MPTFDPSLRSYIKPGGTVISNENSKPNSVYVYVECERMYVPDNGSVQPLQYWYVLGNIDRALNPHVLSTDFCAGIYDFTAYSNIHYADGETKCKFGVGGEITFDAPGTYDVIFFLGSTYDHTYSMSLTPDLYHRVTVTVDATDRSVPPTVDVINFDLPQRANVSPVPFTLSLTNESKIASWSMQINGSTVRVGTLDWYATKPISANVPLDTPSTVRILGKDAKGNIVLDTSKTTTCILGAPSLSLSLTDGNSRTVSLYITSKNIVDWFISETLGASPVYTQIKPTAYTFSSDGLKTLYLTGRDAFGAVVHASATVTVSTVGPTLSVFNAPTTSASTTVPVDFEITAALPNTPFVVMALSEHADMTSATTATASPNARGSLNFKFATTGPKTLYARARDSYGNYSAIESRTLTILTPVVQYDEYIMTDTGRWEKTGNIFNGTVDTPHYATPALAGYYNPTTGAGALLLGKIIYVPYSASNPQTVLPPDTTRTTVPPVQVLSTTPTTKWHVYISVGGGFWIPKQNPDASLVVLDAPLANNSKDVASLPKNVATNYEYSVPFEYTPPAATSASGVTKYYTKVLVSRTTPPITGTGSGTAGQQPTTGVYDYLYNADGSKQISDTPVSLNGPLTTVTMDPINFPLTQAYSESFTYYPPATQTATIWVTKYHIYESFGAFWLPVQDLSRPGLPSGCYMVGPIAVRDTPLSNNSLTVDTLPKNVATGYFYSVPFQADSSVGSLVGQSLVTTPPVSNSLTSVTSGNQASGGNIGYVSPTGTKPDTTTTTKSVMPIVSDKLVTVTTTITTPAGGGAPVTTVTKTPQVATKNSISLFSRANSYIVGEVVSFNNQFFLAKSTPVLGAYPTDLNSGWLLLCDRGAYDSTQHYNAFDLVLVATTGTTYYAASVPTVGDVGAGTITYPEIGAPGADTRWVSLGGSNGTTVIPPTTTTRVNPDGSTITIKVETIREIVVDGSIVPGTLGDAVVTQTTPKHAIFENNPAVQPLATTGKALVDAAFKYSDTKTYNQGDFAYYLDVAFFRNAPGSITGQAPCQGAAPAAGGGWQEVSHAGGPEVKSTASLAQDSGLVYDPMTLDLFYYIDASFTGTASGLVKIGSMEPAVPVADTQTLQPPKDIPLAWGDDFKLVYFPTNSAAWGALRMGATEVYDRSTYLGTVAAVAFGTVTANGIAYSAAQTGWDIGTEYVICVLKKAQAYMGSMDDLKLDMKVMFNYTSGSSLVIKSRKYLDLAGSYSTGAHLFFDSVDLGEITECSISTETNDLVNGSVDVITFTIASPLANSVVGDSHGEFYVFGMEYDGYIWPAPKSLGFIAFDAGIAELKDGVLYIYKPLDSSDEPIVGERLIVNETYVGIITKVTPTTIETRSTLTIQGVWRVVSVKDVGRAPLCIAHEISVSDYARYPFIQLAPTDEYGVEYPLPANNMTTGQGYDQWFDWYPNGKNVYARHDQISLNQVTDRIIGHTFPNWAEHVHVNPKKGTYMLVGNADQDHSVPIIVKRAYYPMSNLSSTMFRSMWQWGKVCRLPYEDFKKDQNPTWYTVAADGIYSYQNIPGKLDGIPYEQSYEGVEKVYDKFQLVPEHTGILPEGSQLVTEAGLKVIVPDGLNINSNTDLAPGTTVPLCDIALVQLDGKLKPGAVVITATGTKVTVDGTGLLAADTLVATSTGSIAVDASGLLPVNLDVAVVVGSGIVDSNGKMPVNAVVLTAPGKFELVPEIKTSGTAVVMPTTHDFTVPADGKVPAGYTIMYVAELYQVLDSGKLPPYVGALEPVQPDLPAGTIVVRQSLPSGLDPFKQLVTPQGIITADAEGYFVPGAVIVSGENRLKVGADGLIPQGTIIVTTDHSLVVVGADGLLPEGTVITTIEATLTYRLPAATTLPTPTGSIYVWDFHYGFGVYPTSMPLLSKTGVVTPDELGGVPKDTVFEGFGTITEVPLNGLLPKGTQVTTPTGIITIGADGLLPEGTEVVSVGGLYTIPSDGVLPAGMILVGAITQRNVVVAGTGLLTPGTQITAHDAGLDGKSGIITADASGTLITGAGRVIPIRPTVIVPVGGKLTPGTRISTANGDVTSKPMNTVRIGVDGLLPLGELALIVVYPEYAKTGGQFGTTSGFVAGMKVSTPSGIVKVGVDGKLPMGTEVEVVRDSVTVTDDGLLPKDTLLVTYTTITANPDGTVPPDQLIMTSTGLVLPSTDGLLPVGTIVITATGTYVVDATGKVPTDTQLVIPGTAFIVPETGLVTPGTQLLTTTGTIIVDGTGKLPAGTVLLVTKILLVADVDGKLPAGSTIVDTTGKTVTVGSDGTLPAGTTIHTTTGEFLVPATGLLIPGTVVITIGLPDGQPDGQSDNKIPAGTTVFSVPDTLTLDNTGLIPEGTKVLTLDGEILTVDATGMLPIGTVIATPTGTITVPAWGTLSGTIIVNPVPFIVPADGLLPSSMLVATLTGTILVDGTGMLPQGTIVITATGNLPVGIIPTVNTIAVVYESGTVRVGAVIFIRHDTTKSFRPYVVTKTGLPVGMQVATAAFTTMPNNSVAVSMGSVLTISVNGTLPIGSVLAAHTDSTLPIVVPAGGKLVHHDVIAYITGPNSTFSPIDTGVGMDLLWPGLTLTTSTGGVAVVNEFGMIQAGIELKSFLYITEVPVSGLLPEGTVVTTPTGNVVADSNGLLPVGAEVIRTWGSVTVQPDGKLPPGTIVFDSMNTYNIVVDANGLLPAGVVIAGMQNQYTVKPDGTLTPGVDICNRVTVTVPSSGMIAAGTRLLTRKADLVAVANDVSIVGANGLLNTTKLILTVPTLTSSGMKASFVSGPVQPNQVVMTPTGPVTASLLGLLPVGTQVIVSAELVQNTTFRTLCKCSVLEVAASPTQVNKTFAVVEHLSGGVVYCDASVLEKLSNNGTQFVIVNPEPTIDPVTGQTTTDVKTVCSYIEYISPNTKLVAGSTVMAAPVVTATVGVNTTVAPTIKGVTIQFRRGNKADLPASAAVGEPLVTMDTGELYIGTGTGLRKISDVVVSETEPVEADRSKLWYRPSENVTRIYKDNAWHVTGVEAAMDYGTF